MKSSFRYLLLLACLWAGLAPSGHAAAIVGQVAITGKAQLNGPFQTATLISTFDRTRLSFGTGDYDFAGPHVSGEFTPLVLDTPLNAPVVLWKFVRDSSEYSFELHEFGVERFELQDNLFLNLSGSGFVSIDGVRRTAANFSFSTQQTIKSSSREITWSAETIAFSVPEGGASWILLILGIIGIDTSRRMFHSFR